MEEINKVNFKKAFERLKKSTKKFSNLIVRDPLDYIDFEIELNIHYGEPVIGFELLPNDLCNMVKENKIEIKFPNK